MQAHRVGISHMKAMTLGPGLEVSSLGKVF